MDADFPLPDPDWAPARELWAGAARGVLRVPRCDGVRPLRLVPGTAVPALRRYRPHLVRRQRARAPVLLVGRAPRLDPAGRRPAAVRHRAGRSRGGPAVRLVTYVVDCVPEALRCDQPVRVVFRPLGYPGVARTVVAPLFTPADA